jgi:isoleucyl-tRNA synthetase
LIPAAVHRSEQASPRVDRGCQPVASRRKSVIQAQPREGFAVQTEGGVVVALDTQLTPALVAEGRAREFVRHVQTLRKDAGLQLSDRIETEYLAAGDVGQAIEGWADTIKAETLSVTLRLTGAPGGQKSESFKLDGQAVTVAVKRVRL